MELNSMPTEITNKIAQQIGLSFVSEKEAEGNVCMANSSEIRLEFKETFSAIDVIDYIYSMVYASKHYKKNKELGKKDLIKVPFPIDSKIFWESVKLGSKIRQNHLLESMKIEYHLTEFSFDGDYIVWI